MAVTAIDQESADVLSLGMQSADDRPLQTAQAGQYVALRLQAIAGYPPLFLSYSLSGPASTQRYRISVKLEPNGASGSHLRDHVRVGDVFDVSSPRESFVLKSGEWPVVLLSAGVGATPVLAMLHALAAAHSTRQVLWLHAAEACEIPVRWSCRTGVCHNCESGLFRGRSPTDRSRSKSRPLATFSYPAHNRFPTSSSICEA
jgi:ferredoxin-NADP reductase